MIADELRRQADVFIELQDLALRIARSTSAAPLRGTTGARLPADYAIPAVPAIGPPAASPPHALRPPNKTNARPAMD